MDFQETEKFDIFLKDKKNEEEADFRTQVSSLQKYVVIGTEKQTDYIS